MLKIAGIVIAALLLFTAQASAQSCTGATFHTFTNGTTADATQVNDNFTCVLSNPVFAGNVGIGTLPTIAELQVNSSFAVTQSGVHNGDMEIYPTVTGSYFIMRNASAVASIVFDNRNTDSSYIDNGGMFGVNTNSPGAMVDVAGSLRVGAANGSGGTSVASNAASVVWGAWRCGGHYVIYKFRR